MSHYGVRRLITINSGGYLYAELDLSRPVHLVAPNNRGKSTLVNSLQFLYVDEMAKMAFGKRTVEDTRQHYFGHTTSYIVFECATPSGTQCLLVRGLGPLRGHQFERYVYQGEYQRADYEDDDRRVIDFERLRTRLANRQLMPVRHSQLWEVLSGQIPAGGSPAPRLGILPVRKQDEYRAFREVFVSLLKLSNLDGQDLKTLIIACHAREITETRIDIAADYRGEFERAERAEHELDFVRSVRDALDRGMQIRQEIAASTDHVQKAGPQIMGHVRGILAQVTSGQQRIAPQLATLKQQKNVGEKDLRDVDRQIGRLEKSCDDSRAALKSLDKEHARWATYTCDMVRAMRDNAQALSDKISQLRRTLAEVSGLDTQTLGRQVHRLERDFSSQQQSLERWEQTAAAALRRAGFSNEELSGIFQVLNPALLTLIEGEGLMQHDSAGLTGRLRWIAQRVQDGKYSDDAVTADLRSLAGPDLELLRDKDRLRDQLKLTEQNLTQARDQLKVAMDRDAAGRDLKDKESDLQRRLAELRAFDDHQVAWQRRDEAAAELERITKQFATSVQSAADVRKEIDALQQQILGLEQWDQDLRSMATTLSSHLQSLVKEIESVGITLAEDSDPSSNPTDTTLAPLELREAVKVMGGHMSGLATAVRKVAPLRDQLQTIEKVIARKSSTYTTAQQVYFSDPEEEWKQLSAKRDALPEMERVTRDLWDGLFTTLGARLNGIRLGMHSIERAVHRINQGLRKYHVSNLREVQLKVEKAQETYPVVEALTQMDTLLQNREESEHAKARLRRWISSGQLIELQSLFFLHIRVQQNDGQWTEAKSLDEIGSTGTGMTAKAMIFIQLMRAIVGSDRYRLHFYIDETGHLDDRNLEATTAMAVSRGITPITAEPDVRIEPLAHPEVTVYSLGQDGQGKFFVDRSRTYHARRLPRSEATLEVDHA